MHVEITSKIIMIEAIFFLALNVDWGSVIKDQKGNRCILDVTQVADIDLIREREVVKKK